MSNKTKLQQHNADLSTALTNVKGLPMAEDVKHGEYVWKKYRLVNQTFKDLNVGDKIKLKVDGIDTGFIAIQQGNPSTELYGKKVDVTYIMTEDVIMSNNTYITTTYGQSNVCFESSLVRQLASNFANSIKPQPPYMGSNYYTCYYADSFDKYSHDSRNGFIPSLREIGLSSEAVDGVTFEYFKTDAAIKRRAAGGAYFTRTPVGLSSTGYINIITASGSVSNCWYNSSSNYIRPIFMYPQTENTGNKIKVFDSYVVSDIQNAYPNDGERSGYWYEKVIAPEHKVILGSVTTTEYSKELKIPCNLNDIYRAWLFRRRLDLSGQGFVNLNYTKDVINIADCSIGNSYRNGYSATIKASEGQMVITLPDYTYGFYAETYDYLIMGN